MSDLPPPEGGYCADGHRLVARVASGTVEVALECPGEERCQDPARDSRGRRHVGERWQCNLKLWFDAEGWSGFVDWQEKPYRRADLPCEIEWRYTGWDDSSELWWRPVTQEETST